MPTNPYRAGPVGPYPEANLYESMIVESIQWSGHDIYYIPRSVNQFDQIYGEDVLASFDNAVLIEMYPEDVQGFGGEGAIISKFGFELRETCTFVVARKRFAELVQPILGDKTPLLQLRPNEGDLLYFPQTKSLFEIKYVDSSDPFNQLQAKFIWKLRCELFQYNSEKFSTGVDEIDTSLNELSLNRLTYTFMTEDGLVLKAENDGTFLQEDFKESLSYSDDDKFKSEFLSIVDFSTDNPFSEKF